MSYNYFSPFWDFYSDNHPSAESQGRGYTGISNENNISGITLNPATLNPEKKFQAYTEYILKANSKWLPLENNMHLQELHPSFLIGIGYNINSSIITGLVFSTNHSFIIDFGKVQITNPESPDGIGSFQNEAEISYNSLTIPLVFKYKGLFNIGVNFSVNYFKSKTTISIIQNNGNYILEDEKVNFKKFNVKFGILTTPIDDVTFGLTFTPEINKNISTMHSDGKEYQFATNVFPFEIGFGVKYKLNESPISLFFDFNHVNTSSVESLVDRNDFHVGFEYEFPETVSTKFLVIRGGIFSKNDYRNLNNNWLKGTSYNQIFTTFGTSIKLSPFIMDLALMDSHFLSSKIVKETYLNVGIRYDF